MYELFTTDRKTFTIKELGYYWGNCYGRWVRVKVCSLPKDGGTGSLAFQYDVDYYGKRYPHFTNDSVALQAAEVLYGRYENKTDFLKSKPPLIGRDILLKLGVCVLFVDRQLEQKR